jgi:glycosyltransferase involved in cell wall biosynthesis
LSAGLLVISSRASAVEELCGHACLYYAQETPQALADAMKKVLSDFPAARRQVDLAIVSDRYSATATTARLQRLLQTIGVVNK